MAYVFFRVLWKLYFLLPISNDQIISFRNLKNRTDVYIKIHLYHVFDDTKECQRVPKKTKKHLVTPENAKEHKGTPRNDKACQGMPRNDKE